MIRTASSEIIRSEGVSDPEETYWATHSRCIAEQMYSAAAVSADDRNVETSADEYIFPHQKHQQNLGPTVKLLCPAAQELRLAPEPCRYGWADDTSSALLPSERTAQSCLRLMTACTTFFEK
jgi:hypothetical protein